MSHYGYVSEQLLNGGVLPRRPHRGSRREWRLSRREARSTPAPQAMPGKPRRPVERTVDVDRIRGYVDLPAPGR